jgi:hypothetical protein
MYKLSRGRLWRLVALLCLFTAFLSAFLDNVTTILLVVPVTMQLCHVLDVDPVLPVMSLVFFSNIGEAVFFLSFCSVEKLQAEPQLRLVILQTFCWCRILDCSCIPRVRSTLVRRRILNFLSGLFSFSFRTNDGASAAWRCDGRRRRILVGATLVSCGTGRRRRCGGAAARAWHLAPHRCARCWSQSRRAARATRTRETPLFNLFFFLKKKKLRHVAALEKQLQEEEAAAKSEEGSFRVVDISELEKKVRPLFGFISFLTLEKVYDS